MIRDQDEAEADADAGDGRLGMVETMSGPTDAASLVQSR